jgi:hypothetical protein
MSSPVTAVIRAQAVKTSATYRRDLGSTSGKRFMVVKVAGFSPSVLVSPCKSPFYQCSIDYSFQCPWSLGHTTVIVSCGLALTRHLASFRVRRILYHRSSSFLIFTLIPFPIYDSSSLSVAMRSQFYCTAVETWARLLTVIWISGQISSLLCRKPKNRSFMFGDCIGFPNIVTWFLWDGP